MFISLVYMCVHDNILKVYFIQSVDAKLYNNDITMYYKHMVWKWIQVNVYIWLCSGHYVCNMHAETRCIVNTHKWIRNVKLQLLHQLHLFGPFKLHYTSGKSHVWLSCFHLSQSVIFSHASKTGQPKTS